MRVWPLAAPDLDDETMHHCMLDEGHFGVHECACEALTMTTMPYGTTVEEWNKRAR